jgi:hypothetical protein
MLLPGLRGVGVHWSRCGRKKKMLQVVEAVVQRRYLPGKEEVSRAAPQSHAKSQDEAEHGPVLETGSLIDLLDCRSGVIRRHVQRMDRPFDRFLKWLLEVLLHHLPDAGSDVLAGLLGVTTPNV